MILYLHGFRSSPESFKSGLLAAALADRGLAAQWCCPQLPASPAAAMRLGLALARQALANADALTVIGSSLGGFYTTWLAEQLGCRAVLLNPVVHASRDLATQVGSHRTFHGNHPFEFLPEYVDELARAEADIPELTHPERYFLLAATGDEVLNWREMQQRFSGARQHIIQGSDHGLSDFSQWLPEVLAFSLTGPMAVSQEGARPGMRAKQAPVVITGTWNELSDIAGPIRLEVFVHEQGVPLAEEMDLQDAQCVHAVAYAGDGQAVGTGRLLPDGHIGRMAVRHPWRGAGVGSLLLNALMDAARQRGDTQVVLAAQLQARPFYARHGFVEEGETFMDAGIEHRQMRLRF